jgi:oleate hydratase
MNSLPQHSAMEMRRFMLRFLHVLPDLSRMTSILRTRYNQQDTIIRPITSWLERQGVTFRTGTRVVDVGFLPARDRITATALTIDSPGQMESVEVAPEDIVLVTNGSQVEGLTVGSMTSAPPPTPDAETCALWRRLALGRPAFGSPQTFFGPSHIRDTAWVTFTVTETQPVFTGLMSALTASEPGRAGLITLAGSNWLLTLAIFHKPEFVGQPEAAWVWWGYGLSPDRPGTFVGKPMRACSGAEILSEVLHHLKFGRQADEIVARSTCIPCLLPYAGSVWLPRSRTSRPRVVPEGATNFGFIGQFAEVPLDAAFTMEYAVRTAWHAVATLTRHGRKPPPVYQGSHDIAALRNALATLA